VSGAAHPLLDRLLAAARGSFPPVDGGVTVAPALDGGFEAIVAFTGHVVIATSLSLAELLDAGADGYGGATSPDVQRAIAGPDGWIDTHDVTLVASGLGDDGSRPLLARRDDLMEHPRVAHARHIRSDVRVHGDDRGLVILARGLAGRTELSLELVPERLGAGEGAGLLTEVLRLVPAGSPVFAAVAPGNARSLRMFLRHGFTPVGSEIQIRPRRCPMP
jgi:hypothetical protein